MLCKLFAGAAFAAVLALGTSANAYVYTFTVNMDGPSEFPANGSPGTGTGTVVYDDVAHTLALNCSFSGLVGTTTNSHIHAPTASPFNFSQTAGVATTTPTFAGFPSGVTSGSYSNTLNMTLSSSYNPAYITANGGTTTSAEIALANAMTTGRSYWNIHSSAFPGGEIRGFLVPEPMSATAIASGLGLFALRRRRSV
jgi:hypothetical protein